MIQPNPELPIAPEDYLPARMINEMAYCPRLYYLMHVEGLFERNRYTTEGKIVHKRVDKRVDPLKTPELFQPEDDGTDSVGVEEDENESNSSEVTKVHARSVSLSSDVLGVIAKLDLVEAEGDLATPVDYKRGKPRYDHEGNPDAWLPEKVQICLQAIVLRENGYRCDNGVLYFNETRQRVTIPIDESLIRQTERLVEQARLLQEQTMPPPPLVESPKCPKCSLSPICLPDETNRCRPSDQNVAPIVRLPATPRDELRPLYLNTQGMFIGKSGEVLQVKSDGKLVEEVRLRDINQVNLFGNIQVSTQAMQTLLSLDIPLTMFSSRGYFRGMLQGTGLKNIVLRREQFRMADDSEKCLRLAKLLVAGKIRNCRVLLQRNHLSPPAAALKELKRIAGRVASAPDASILRGMEGNAARIYFQHFAGMIKTGDHPTDPAEALGSPPKWTFDFRRRSRRPPQDPVNAMLSLAYSMLTKDLTVTAAAIGLDAYLGFYHCVRPGRPALSLDLMEPFRPLIADSVVLTAINNRMMTPEHFVAAGRGVTMTESGRKAFFRAYELRMDQLVTHPLFDYRVSYRRLIDIQTRLAAKMIRGEIEEFPIFVSR
ncbi:MAG: CRISPR-associated endonuclease Cas1 [Phycisphaera sp. RhM]|nr:CRISPR-associated endonuclease Cas1 [Phycisphaera sp. RhM]